MPKLKAGTILPAPAEDAAITAAAKSDPDGMPFTDAQWEQAKPLLRRDRQLGHEVSPRRRVAASRRPESVIETP